MKRNIVLEHRQALDEFERAATAHATCRRKGQCGDGTKCLTCPAHNNLLQAKATFEDKSIALKKVNDQIVAQNDVIALKHREESQLKRQQREAKKAENSTEKAGLNVAMKQKADKPTIEQKYERTELTAERYDAHKKDERLSDAAIVALYGIPKSTFERWKRDNEITNKPIALYDAKAATEVIVLQQKIEKLEAENESITEQQKQAQTSNEGLVEKLNKVSNELTVSQEMNQLRQDMIKSLEADLKVYQSTDPLPIEEDVDYKTLYEQSCAKRTEVEAEREHFKQLAADRLDTNARLQAIIHVNVTKYNKQIEKFEGYEKNLLERVLHLLSSR